MNDSSLSTTTSLSRIDGFSITLLFLLKDGYLRTKDICEKLGKYRQYVNRYLYNLQNYGLVEKIEDFWILTEEGSDFIEYLETVDRRFKDRRKIEERKKKERRNLEERKKKDNLKKQDLLCPTASFKDVRGKIQQIQLDIFFRKNNLDEIEKEVVEVLIEHYNKTGSKFILVKDQYELAEKLNANPSDLPNALKNLRQDGIIYIYRDKTFGYWKIGLKKAFLEVLQKQ